MGSYFVNELTVIDVKPSASRAGLVDLTVTLWCENALPGAERPWELLRTGHLNHTGMWHELAPEDRHAWLSVALWSREYQSQGKSDAPAGQVFTVDGRHIVDRDTFYCAIGEAINGPGGYFGWNLDALDDRLRGGWGATTPFSLHWDFSDEARTQLAKRVPAGDRELALFDLLLEIFKERGCERHPSVTARCCGRTAVRGVPCSPQVKSAGVMPSACPGGHSTNSIR
ncbi:barstar family protein [Streptomyces sp. NPDC046859]|uniref:barstar family protein n=1 Tax=Streptomyces sp. NPDC046859 TaxID=3155734 RepID=UPI00341071D0